MNRVLLIDDSKLICRTWGRLLDKRTHRTMLDTAHTVATAIKHLKTHEYDVVICDFQLPDGTGAEIHTWIKENKTQVLTDGAFFFHTGVPHLAEQECGPGLQFIGKPFRPDELDALALRLNK